MVFKMRFWIALSLGIIINFTVLTATAQTTAVADALSSISKKQIAEARESVYMQFDKPYYTSGDTIWYKAYVFDASSFNSSTKSGLLHIDVSDEKGEKVKSFILPLIIGIGLGWGDIPLNEDLMPPGIYTLRAYTNWMRNYSEEAAFTQTFHISGKTENTWLVKAITDLKSKTDSAALNISLHNLNMEPVRLQSLRIKVSNGSKTLGSGKAQTGVDGVLGFSFPLPAKATGKQVLLSLTEDSKTAVRQQIIMPLPIDRAVNTYLQFMPEGGNLVAGINSNIGFKATAEDGSSMPVSGEILDGSNQTVAGFKTQFNGMGNFQFTPQAGEIYTASVNLPGGKKKTYPLPAIKSTGTVMNIINPNDTIALFVTIKASALGGIYYLIGQGRGLASYGAMIRLTEKERVIKVPKNIFPTGIARISLLDRDHKPLNERLVYIDHHDQLHISMATEKQTYSKRDSIGLQVTVTDAANNPVKGSFSLAITDNGQVKTDSINQYNIFTRTLISAGIKGDIEAPGHYLQQSPEAWDDLDRLLYTQGWTAYDWEGAFVANKEPKFKAEPEFEVKGKVTNAFGKALAGTKVSLFSLRPLIVKDTITDAKGMFTFNNFPQIDTPAFNIKTLNKRDKAFNVGVTMEIIEPPVFSQTQRVQMPWNANTDTVMLKNAVNKALTDKEELALLTNGGKILNEVKIKALKSIKGSRNLNPLNGSDQILDETEMLKAKDMNLLYLMQNKVKGFSYDIQNGFRVHNQQAYFIFDGIKMNDAREMDFFEQMGILKSFSAEDITGIEVMTSMKNAMLYSSKYNPGVIVDYINTPPAFIEITTRGKHGPFNSVNTGMALFRGTPLEWPKQHFYSPKYSKKQNTAIADRRSTIFWEPNVITGADGKATLSFYTSDIAGTYTIILEGADMAGSIGTVTKTLKVN